MQDIVVAGVAMNARLGKVEQNLAVHENYLRLAAKKGAELVLFPELSVTGHWCDPAVWEAAESVPDGPSTQRMTELARELDLVIGFGLAEKKAGVVYNAYVLVSPEGFLGRQHKLHGSSDEYFYFRGGGSFEVVDIGKCRMGACLCYDCNFPETPRVLAVLGAELIAMPHAARIGKWPQEQAPVVAANKAHVDKVYRARAWENGAYVVYVNQAGRAGPKTNHAGGVFFIDPNGDILAGSQSKRIEESLVVARLEAARLHRRRSARCFPLATRRAELFGALCTPPSLRADGTPPAGLAFDAPCHEVDNVGNQKAP